MHPAKKVPASQSSWSPWATALLQMPSRYQKPRRMTLVFDGDADCQPEKLPNLRIATEESRPKFIRHPPQERTLRQSISMTKLDKFKLNKVEKATTSILRLTIQRTSLRQTTQRHCKSVSQEIRKNQTARNSSQWNTTAYSEKSQMHLQGNS